MLSDFLRRSEILLKPPPLDPRMFYQRSMNRYRKSDHTYNACKPRSSKMTKPIHVPLHVKFDDPSNYSAN